MYLLKYLLRQKFIITLLAYNYLLLFFDEIKIIINVKLANAVMNQLFQNTSNAIRYQLTVAKNMLTDFIIILHLVIF